MSANQLSFTERCKLKDELSILQNALDLSKDDRVEMFGYCRVVYSENDRSFGKDQKFLVTKEFQEKMREYIQNRIAEITKKLDE